MRRANLPLAGCGKTIVARETGETSETGQTRWKPNLFTSRLSRMSRASLPTVHGRWRTFFSILLLRKRELGLLSLIDTLLHQRANIEHAFDLVNVVESGFCAGVRRREE